LRLRLHKQAQCGLDDGGDFTELARQPGIKNVPEILLARAEVTYATQDEISPGLKKASIVANVRSYRLRPTHETDVYTVLANGAGFSNETALVNASERLATSLRSGRQPGASAFE
jgi:hypothetical protein